MRSTTSVVAAWLVLAGCTPDLTGILSPDRTGNLLSPPAERGSPLAPIRAACGEPGVTSGSLRRWPYLQSLGSDGATLTWTSTAEPEVVRIWAAGGEPRSVASSVEPTVYLRRAAQHRAQLADLTPATTYCYELGDRSGNRVFGPSGFRTAPLATSEERIDFAVFGDSGFSSSDQRAVAAQLETIPIEFMLHTGDLAYPSGTLDELERNHFPIYQDLASSVPLFPSIGDHDQATDAAGPFREVFTLPANGSAERYYSFDWGPVHVVVLDALSADAAQLEWTDRDLGSTALPWRVVVLHMGPYSAGWHGSNTSFRERYAAMLARRGVQLVLSGDDHDYQRSRPIDGVTYVVTGGGGRSVRPTGTAEWTAFSATTFHLVYVTVEGGMMRVRAIDATGREFDGVEIALAAR